MGLSSKKTKTTSNETSTVAPSDYNKPHLDAAAATMKPAYDEGMAIQRQFQPGLTGSFNYYRDVQDGKYINNNPYLEDMIAASNRDAGEGVDQSFMPRFGSGYHAKVKMRAIAENSARMRGESYERERAYQDQAGQKMAGLATTATMLPAIPSTTYAQNVGGLMGRYNTATGSGTSTSKQSGGFFGDLLLAMAANAGKFGGGGG